MSVNRKPLPLSEEVRKLYGQELDRLQEQMQAETNGRILADYARRIKELEFELQQDEVNSELFMDDYDDDYYPFDLDEEPCDPTVYHPAGCECATCMTRIKDNTYSARDVYASQVAYNYKQYTEKKEEQAHEELPEPGKRAIKL